MTTDDLVVERDEVLLAGSLWLPDRRPASVVVMHPGSGPSDRHNDVHFPPIRSALLAAGHAAASFDKRGVGSSTGSLSTTSIEQQAGDLLACVEAVRDRLPGVPVGAFGHSQGGWVVYEAAGTTDAVDFAIANSGPAVAPLEQERHALRVATDGQVDQPTALALFDELAERARAGQTFTDVIGELDRAGTGSLRGFAGAVLHDEVAWQLTTLLFAYDPAPALAAIEVPLLAVFGADDPVVPVDDSIAALRNLVDERFVEILVFDGAGHRLERADDTGFVDGYLDAVVDFVNVCSARSTDP
jgi:pimeloyl-ACP methyl ester carboxylesterase